MPESFPCDRCDSVFQRREHLQRHVRVHTKERPFSCSVCEQKDALSRHYSSQHQPAGARDNAPADQSKAPRASKACQPCSASKVRCDGDTPCRRCCQSNTSCFYKSTSKRKGPDMRQRAPKQRRLAQNQQEASPTNTADTVEVSAIADECQGLTPDLSTVTCSTLETFSSDVPRLDSLSGVGSGADVDPVPLDTGVEKMDEIADPLSMDLFNSIMNWDYSSFDGTNLTVSCILGVDMPEYVEMNMPVPATGLPGLVDDSTEPMPCLSPRLNNSAVTETSIAECYSRAHSPPLDRGKMGLGEYVTDRAESEGRLEFPDMTGFTAQELDREDHAHVEPCDLARFQPVYDLAEKIRISAFFPLSMRLKLPPAEVLNAFIQLYFEHFHPHFPLIHMPTFSSPDTHPLLMFAVASIGAKYSKLKGAQKFALAMHELIRQQTTYLSEHVTKLSREPWLLQTILLNLIGLMYSGDKRSLLTAELMQSAPVVLARRSRLFEERLSPEKMATLQLSRDRLWKLWVFAEGRRRLAHAIWIIDSNFRLHFDLCTTMDFSEIRNCLPQSDKLWSAPSAQAWANTTSLLDPIRDTTIQELFDSTSQSNLWISTSTLGRQAIAQFLWYTTLERQRTMGWIVEAPSDAVASERAAKHLSDLVSLDNAPLCDDSVELPILQIIFHIAQAKHHCPIPNFSDLIIRYLCNALDESTLEEATQLWAGSIRSAKTAILHASCVIEIIRRYRPTSFGVSVMQFKAVLMLWSYSKFLLPKSDVTEESELGRDSRSVLLSCRTKASSKDVWLNDDKAVAKLAGIGHLDNASSRRKLLEEAISFMEMGSIWKLGQCLAKCLVRLKERELEE